MNCWAMQPGFTGRSPLLLQAAVILLLCQFAMWASHPAPVSIPASGFRGNERSAIPSTSPFRLLSSAAPSPWFTADPGRYYDPAVAAAAEGLDAESRYFVAMALEDCYALAHEGIDRLREDFAGRLQAGAPDQLHRGTREHAFHRSLRHCAAFEGNPISPDRILALLRGAAHEGDPRAIARTLLFRDLAESKTGTFDLVTRVLTSGDPHAFREIGFFLARGESMLTVGEGGSQVRATSLAAAWELAACDFGLDCGSDSKMLNTLCAYQGQCGAMSYEDWLGRYIESGDELAEILRLRTLIRRGLMMQDWVLLGLSVLK